MNEVISSTTRSLIGSLYKGKEQHSFSGVKAEFEAEGSRVDDLKILLFAGKTAGLETIVKIGGCEALRDMRDLASMGRVENVVAPMIESPFALQKFINMSRKVADESGFRPHLYFNLETVSAWRSFDEILDLASSSDQVHGVTFGRGDFAESLGLARSEVDSSAVSDVVLQACQKVVARNLKFCVGGSITAKSIGVLRDLSRLNAHAFESRKISWFFDDIPPSDEEFTMNLEAGLRFELDWLESKRERYLRMADEDESRRSALKSRFS
jgi:hypothetical protein